MTRNLRRVASVAAVIAVCATVGTGQATAAISTANFCAGVTPGSSGFTDISTVASAQRSDIECLAASRITSGTGPSTYGPTGNVFRDSMATFVANLVDTANTLERTTLAALPGDGADAFTDDEQSIHERNINRLAAVDIVNGKTATTYGPNGPGNEVTRGQMATFLVAAIDYLRPTNLPAGPNAFADDAGNAHEANINKLAAIDVVDGTGPTTYGPNDRVSRAQMASFLIRTLAYLHSQNEINALPPSTRSIVISPSGDVSNPTDSVAGGEITLQASNIRSNDVDVQLFPCENVTATGTTLAFRDVAVDDGAADADGALVEADIVSIGGSAQPANTEFAGGRTPTNGTLTFTVDSPSADCVVAVVWDDADDDDRLDLDSENRPTEGFGASGRLTFVPPPAAAGPMDENVNSNDEAGNSFVGCEITSVSGAPETASATDCATFTYDSNDLFRVSGQGVSLAEFETALSTGDDVGGTYNPTGTSTFELVDEAPVAPAEVTAAPAGSTVVNVSFSEVPSADSYRVYRGLQGSQVQCGAFTTSGANAYTLAATVPGGSADGDAGTTNSVAVSGLQPDTDYCFVVSSVDEGDEGPPSAPDGATTAAANADAPLALDTELTHDADGPTTVDAGDVIRVCFSQDMNDPAADGPLPPLFGDTETITLRDGDGTTATATQGSTATFTRVTVAEADLGENAGGCAANRQLRITLNASFAPSGGTLSATSTQIIGADEIQSAAGTEFDPTAGSHVDLVVDVEPAGT